MTDGQKKGDGSFGGGKLCRPLSERDEHLLTSYYDHECGFVSAFRAKRLLKRSTAAHQFLQQLKSFGSSMRACEMDRRGADGEKLSVDLWDQISNRIEAEMRTEILLGERPCRRGSVRTRLASRLFDRVGEWRSRFAWGMSGAALASVMSALLIQAGYIGARGQLGTQAESPGRFSRIPLASQVSFGNTQGFRASPVEMDWVRSEGRVRMMHHPNEGSPIIWVRPRSRAAQSMQVEYPQRISRKYVRSNSHIPVAIPASGR